MREMGHVAKYMIENSNKLGVDIDEETPNRDFKALITFFNAKYLFPDKEVKIYKSCNGKGWHIVVYGVKSTLKIRELLGDCEGRREYSEMRACLTGQVTGDEVVDDVMFDWKSYIILNGKKLKTKDIRKREEIPEWNFLLRRQWK